MENELPHWLHHDSVRRGKLKKARGGFLRTFISAVKTVMWLGLLVGFVWLLVLLYGVVGEWAEAEPISYIAPQRAEAAVVSEFPSAREEHEVVLATVTAYTSSVDETDDTPFITASGATTGHGVIACPSKYDFGTKVIIGDTEYTCEDRMNRRYWEQDRFDIWVETKKEAYHWGIQEVEVKIIAQRQYGRPDA